MNLLDANTSQIVVDTTQIPQWNLDRLSMSLMDMVKAMLKDPAASAELDRRCKK